MIKMQIGCIGLGNMGGSIARLLIQNAEPKEPLLLANRSPEKAEKIARELGGRLASNQEVFAQADVIFLGVKPSQMKELFEMNRAILENRDSILLISMAAGLTLEQLASYIPTKHRFIRIMPNTSIAVGAGVVTYSLSTKVNQTDEELLCNLLASAGLLVRLDEKQLEAATALAGCGPAFVYQFIESLADAGVQNGLSRDLALQLANQTVLGSAQLAKESQQHPALLKDQVCSPAGATIAGVASLEADGFRGSVIKAVRAAYQRSQELGKG